MVVAADNTSGESASRMTLNDTYSALGKLPEFFSMKIVSFGYWKEVAEDKERENSQHVEEIVPIFEAIFSNEVYGFSQSSKDISG